MQATQLIAEQFRRAQSNRMTLRDAFVNIKDMGANGDGSDDSKAMEKALRVGLAVFLPKGVYDVSNMEEIGGRVTLFSFGDATVIGFKYSEQAAPRQNINATTSRDDAFFYAEHINFEGIGSVPGLTIKNQSQGTVIRSFNIYRCDFRGPIGLQTENCISSVISGCDFIHNQYAWKALSCTNLVVTDSQFFSPIIGVFIDQSSTDTANRKGGENIKFQGCTWIDGVVAIHSIDHNYLWMSSSLIDYFNTGLYLKGSKFARLENVYIGYHDQDKSIRTDYIAPIEYGCIYACGNSLTSRNSGLEASNSEFYIYGTSTKTLVRLDGAATTSFTGIQEVDISDCRFGSDEPNNTNPYLLQINKAFDVLHSGNKYFSANNNNLIAPWTFTNIQGGRIFSERNNIVNCYKTDGSKVIPSTGNAGNETYESATISISTNGTAVSEAATYTYKNSYTTIPRVIATVKSSTSGVPPEKLNVGVAAIDGSVVYLRVAHIDGTALASSTNSIQVNIFVIGE